MARLAIELSPQPCSLALSVERDNQAAQCLEHEFSGERGRALLTEIDRLCQSADIDKSQLSQIIVGLGPGSYTGLRIACTAARSLSFALDVPAAGLTSFEAALFQLQVGEEAHVVLDAFRGEVYHAHGVRREADVDWIQAPCVRPFAEWRAECTDIDVLIADQRMQTRLQEDPLAAADIRNYAPRASSLLGLAAARGNDRLLAVEPMYLRAAAFKPK